MSETLRHLVLVRHGQSEGDVRREAWRHGRKFDTDKTPDEEGLTSHGYVESEAAGTHIRDKILGKYVLDGFDLCYVSGVLRAEQTAGAIDIPDTIWQEDARLSERDRGHIRGRTGRQHKEKYPDSYERMLSDPLHWTPPGGESMLDVVDKLAYYYEDIKSYESVLIVGHRDSMWAFAKFIENLSDEEFVAYNTDEIRNGQIWHYAAAIPGLGNAPRLAWKRVVDPLSDYDSGWLELPNVISELPEPVLG